jgi:hypothetical protein
MREVSAMDRSVARTLLLLAAALALACSESHPDKVKQMSTNVGHTVTVTLETTGYGHFEDPVVSQPIVQFLDSSSGPGAGKVTLLQVYRFAASAPGLTEIRFHHTAFPVDTVVELSVSP